LEEKSTAVRGKTVNLRRADLASRCDNASENESTRVLDVEQDGFICDELMLAINSRLLSHEMKEEVSMAHKYISVFVPGA
jgi:hypothetical protein